MKDVTRFVLLAGIALFSIGSAVAQQPGTQATAPAGDAKAGEKLFMSIGCLQCHGRAAQGSSFTGPRLAPEPVPFAAFVHQLRQPASEMPPYETAVLSDKDAADIYAFLQTVPKPPDYKTIPLLGGS
jgi:mono/diheme cytochrome c family protein